MKAINCLFVSFCFNICFVQTVLADSHLKPFASDECTLSPNGWWGQCCIEHDVSYWMGGTQQARETADNRFRRCIKKVDGPYHLYWLGVQIGGGPEGPNEYRWGFGWAKRYYYNELSPEQQSLVEFELNMWRLTEEYAEFVNRYREIQGEEPWW